MCFNQRGDISTRKGGFLKLVDKLTYLGGSVSSTENDIITRLVKTSPAIDRLLVKWKSGRSDKIKYDFFQSAVVSILLYGCTTWTHIEKKLDGNCRRILWAILYISWKQRHQKQHLYGHIPPISKTIQIRWTTHAEYCWRGKEKLISDVLWSPSHGRASLGRPAWTLQQLNMDRGCSLEDLPEAMDDRGGGWKSEIYASSTTWGS